MPTHDMRHRKSSTQLPRSWVRVATSATAVLGQRILRGYATPRGVGPRVRRPAPRAGEPAAGAGLQEHRLRAADAAGGAGGGPAGGELVGDGEDRVWVHWAEGRAD